MPRQKITTRNGVKTLLKAETRALVNNMRSNAAYVLQTEIDNSMNSNQPSMYDRTGEFQNALVETGQHFWGSKGYKQEVKYSPEKITTMIPYTRKLWGTHMGKDGTDFRKSLFDALDKGTAPGLGYMRNGEHVQYSHPGYHFTEAAIDELKSMYKGGQIITTPLGNITTQDSDLSIVTKKQKIYEAGSSGRFYTDSGIVIRHKTLKK